MARRFDSSAHKASDVFYDHSCSACEEDGRNNEATCYCKQCTKKLCDSCLKQHDKFLKGHTVFGKTEVSKWGVVKRAVSKVMCEEHDGNEVQLYCADHDCVCCHVCISVSHRSCRKVDHIPDVAKGIQSSSEFKALPGTVKKSLHQLDAVVERKNKNRKQLEEKYKSIEVSIKQTRENLIQKILAAEKKSLDDLEALYTKLEKSIQDDIDPYTNNRKQLEKTFNDTVKHGPKDECYAYIGLKKCTEKMTGVKSLCDRRTSEYGVTFSLDSKVDEILASLEKLGTLKSELEQYKRFPTDHVFTVDKVDKHSVRVHTDRDNCSIRGVCKLPDGTFVISDSGVHNRKLKLLNESFSVIAQLDMPGYPQDVCHIADMEVAVAVTGWNNMHEIHFVRADHGKLVLHRKVTLKHDCTGLSYREGKLFVRSGDSLYIYTLNGDLVKEKRLSSFDKYYNQCTFSSNNNIHTTDYGNNSLMTLNSNLDILATLIDPDLQGPSGVCVTPDGHVFVCGKKSNTVLQVDKDGNRKITKLLSESDGIKRPFSLFFDAVQSRMIIGQFDDIILVITLK